MPSTRFVGREAELSRLCQCLDKAMAGESQVAFIVGEAGSGKSALVGEFVRRACEANAQLVAATGECNAQTGAGDPYLPFREVLMALTTAAEGAKSAGKSTPPQHVPQLKEFVRVASETLFVVGPDLVGLFVPGASLVTKVAGVAAHQGKLADKLAERVGKRGDSPSTNKALDQERIFEQYASVLCALAKHAPLVLVLDDLQWADSGSLNLLFYLSRKLADSRVLIVGTFRIDDVALGRDSQRHPLEPILNEIKRYRGDVVIDLGAAQAAEGRAFVDALIDSEPNMLGTAFRRELFERTDGHPLFTVETLRNLQERGDLVKDADGRWIQGLSLDWDALPARVDGVIEERIARLNADQRETLSVGSVVGIDFAAQVVSRVQHGQERELVRQLSHELDKRHHLVREQGELKAGKHFLSVYRFSHVLFQQFLYNNLGAGERRVLHGDVAEALEALYLGHTDEIALQLAQHYQEAGDDENAAVYLIRAGDAAFSAYANTEAAAHYLRALSLGAQSLTAEQLQHLFVWRGRAYELNHQYQAALQNYDEMRAEARRSGDRKIELAGLLATATLRSVLSGVPDAAKGEELSKTALKLALELGDRAGEAKALWNLMLVHLWLKDDQPKAIAYGEQSLAIARELNLEEQTAYSTTDLAVAYILNGQLDEAEDKLDAVGELWHALGNLGMLAYNLNQHMLLLFMRGKYEKMFQAGEENSRANQVIESLWNEGMPRLYLSYVWMERGEFAKALEMVEESIRLFAVDERIFFADVARASLFWYYATLGVMEKGMDLYHMLRVPDEAIMQSPFETWTRVLYALFEIASGQLETAKTTLHHCDAPPALPWFTWKKFAECRLALSEGDYALAIAASNEAVERMRQIQIHPFLPDALFAKGQAHAKLGERDSAKMAFSQARAEAEALGCRRMLWQILLALAALEDDPARAGALRAQARDVIDFIADHMPPDLRAEFMKQTELGDKGH